MRPEILIATACILLLAMSEGAQPGAPPHPIHDTPDTPNTPNTPDSPDSPNTLSDSPEGPPAMIQDSTPGLSTRVVAPSPVSNLVESHNGVRLITDDGRPMGRLEVTAREPRFARSAANKTSWVAVCDFAFTDLAAETMCKLLGYTYGRKYYAPGVNARASTTSNYTAGYFRCSAKGPTAATGRRLLRNQMETNHRDGALAAASVAVAPAGGDGGWGQHQPNDGPRQRALSSLQYNLNTSTTAPYACGFSLVTCDPLGLLVGIECANGTFPWAPPPPPLPPTSPAAPPPYSDLIRLVGGPSAGSGTVERNLCNATSAQFCAKYSRVEMLVTLSGFGDMKTWAPLCAVNGSLAQEVARVACQQEYNWPSLRVSPPYTITHSLPDGDPLFFTIPRGMAIAKGDFNPANVMVWATVESVDATRKLRTLQDFNVTISSSICRNGNLFALSCAIGQV
ncbi:hypothetical protein VaNZ11_007913 [Volvox africanus]|uniref:SRCR domain-containing protein n=1 Tax=Volvox africanus TaxID=51714 RepID=A0ABQ5S3X9_9CHLO|nr:hypothetical protein VaNZ11_007913 [Volvox africanus]